MAGSAIAKAVNPNCPGTRKHPNKPCLTLLDNGVVTCLHCGIASHIGSKQYQELNWQFNNGMTVNSLLRHLDQGKVRSDKPTDILSMPLPSATAKPTATQAPAATAPPAVPPKQTPPAQTVKKEPMPYSTTLSSGAIEYFLSRGISEETLTQLRVGAQNKTINFNYFLQGERINTKYRPYDKKKFWQDGSATKKIFYNLDSAEYNDTVVITEGCIDTLSVAETGIDCGIISVPDGAPSPEAKNYETKFDYILNCEKELSHIKKIIIATDGDYPGEILKKELARRMDIMRCYEVKWPEGRKDANDVLCQDGQEALKQLIEEAVPMPIEHVMHVTELADAYDYRYDNQPAHGKLTGWENVNKLYTITPGELCVVVGIPSAGKSEIIDALMVNLSIEYGWRHAIFSPENLPIEMHLGKLAQKYIGKPFEKTCDNRMTKEESIIARKWLAEHFVFINPPEESCTIETIIEKAKLAVRKYAIRTICIDPYNELENATPQGMPQTDFIGNQLRLLKRFARDNGVAVWLVCHPTKLPKLANGKYAVPTPYDIASSANFRNKADVCLAIWRDPDDEFNYVQFHVQKVRFQHTGKVGMTNLIYDLYTGRYRSASDFDDDTHCPSSGRVSRYEDTGEIDESDIDSEVNIPADYCLG